MKTTVVPAQITTVEDRIAGTLTFPQIILLIIPLITGAAIYSGIPPKIHFTLIKLVLIGSQWLFFGGLALRVRGKIIGDWLILYLRFTLRPRLYIFTKNDLANRDIAPAKLSKEAEQEQTETIGIIEKPSLPLSERIKLERLLTNPLLSIQFKPARKGGIDVALKPVKE
ncbi:MAG TPA: hypothetical protein PK263_02025 [bacterium]|nr:hypothetical protein [bacterium]